MNKNDPSKNPSGISNRISYTRTELASKFEKLILLKENMENKSKEKRTLLSGEKGTHIIQAKIRDLEKRKYRVSNQEKEALQNMIDEYNAQIEENKYLIKNVQSDLNDTSNKILELSKEIFSLSTDIIMNLLNSDENGFNADENSEDIDQIEIHYFVIAVARMKRICKLYPEEIEKLEEIDFKRISSKLRNELKELFEIQRETLEIVCSPIIEVIPESQRIIEQ